MAEPRQSVDSFSHSKPFPFNSDYSVLIPPSPIGKTSPRPMTPMTSNTGHATPTNARYYPVILLIENFKLRRRQRKTREVKYKILYDQFISQPMKRPNDFKEWSQYLRKQLYNNDEEVESYHDWVRKQLSRPRPDVSLPSLAESILSANWNQGNESMKHLNSVISSTRYDSTQKVQDLGWTWDNFRMGLKVNGQPLTPLPTEPHTIEAYGVDILSPGLILGMRYSCVDNRGNQDLLFAPLGRIFLSPIGSDEEDDWLDAKLALMLEILKDGTAGKLLIISVVGHRYEQWSDEMDNGDSTPTRLPDQPKFTVAQIDETVRLEPESPNNDQDIRDKLKVESISELLIVETGEKLQPDMEPIALFPLDKIEHEVE